MNHNSEWADFSPLVFWLWAPDGLSSNIVDVDFLTYIVLLIFKPNFWRSKRDQIFFYYESADNITKNLGVAKIHTPISQFLTHPTLHLLADLNFEQWGINQNWEGGELHCYAVIIWVRSKKYTHYSRDAR